ncbi:MAG TPA: DUF2247 family protein [Actinomycetota bacterium]|jgi:hypothetical protein|nr:DUF2247 family protein [Actinomycetota bacterium]
MMISFELSLEFLNRQGIPLSVEDVRYGFERGWLRPQTVIEWAVHQVEKNESDPIVIDIASLLMDEIDRVPAALDQLDSPDRIHDPRSSSRKWLYLQLRAAYEKRRDLADPLGVVETIYSDFDYPQTLEGFVRYMPLRPGDDPGEVALLQRWAAYLKAEQEALKRNPSGR